MLSKIIYINNLQLLLIRVKTTDKIQLQLLKYYLNACFVNLKTYFYTISDLWIKLKKPI